MAVIRYIVHDVDEAIAFYTGQLGFELAHKYGAAMAVLTRGDLELWCAGPSASASQRMPDGRSPEPGGWARFVLLVCDLADLAPRLQKAGVNFRSAIVSGPGGRQVLIEDPSGNIVELFETAA